MTNQLQTTKFVEGDVFHLLLFFEAHWKKLGGGCDFCWGNSTISNYHHDRSYFHWGHAWLPDEWGQGVKVWGRRVEFGQLGGGLNRLWKHGLKWKLWEEFVRFCLFGRFGRVWRFVDVCCIWNDMRRCFQNHSVSRTELIDWIFNDCESFGISWRLCWVGQPSKRESYGILRHDNRPQSHERTRRRRRAEPIPCGQHSLAWWFKDVQHRRHQRCYEIHDYMSL